jgi:NTP pyrophosphatase (non-canonical NTP hydrolase)
MPESFIPLVNIEGTIMLADLMKQFEHASATYASEHGIDRDPDWFLLKLHEELGELTQIWNKASGRARRKGMWDEQLAVELANETADVFGHILLFARQNDLDMVAAIERKWRFRPQQA